MHKYETLNKIVLFISQDYIQKTVDDGALIPDIMYRLKSSIAGYKKFHMFSEQEAKDVLKLAKSEEIDGIMSKKVSFIVFAMELMKLWQKEVPKRYRPHLNISDKHFKLGGKVFWKQMMALKHSDAEDYDHKSSVIDDSISVANKFFNYHREVFLK